ncbi:hypothetical protein Tco_0959440 [Tanacetum coccineum]
MRTRYSSNLIVESSTTPKRRNRKRSKQRVEPFSLEETFVVTMADQRTMAELLQAPTRGYEDAIVIPAILAENFELKHGLLNLFEETFSEAWDRFKDLLRACPHHGFTESHQLDIFNSALNPTNQDSLNAAVDVSANTSSSTTVCPSEIDALTDAVKAVLLQKSSPPPSVKAVEEICVTCGGPHPYHQGDKAKLGGQGGDGGAWLLACDDWCESGGALRSDVGKQMWILGTNLIFAFPHKFWSSFRVPSYFDYRNTILLELLDFLIHDLHWFFHKVEFVIESKLFHWNDKGFASKGIS